MMMNPSHPYFDAFTLIERLHRHFLDVLKIDLEKSGVLDINNVQALLLYNMGGDEMTVGELTVRGHYLGSNVSYNVKKLVETGYLTQERSLHDKRAIRLKQTEKTTALRQLMQKTFEKHVTKLSTVDLDIPALHTLNGSLKKLERFWTLGLAQGL